MNIPADFMLNIEDFQQRDCFLSTPTTSFVHFSMLKRPFSFIIHKAVVSDTINGVQLHILSLLTARAPACLKSKSLHKAHF